MSVGACACHASARCAFEEALPDEIRLDYVFDGGLLLSGCCCDRIETYRTAIELIDDDLKHSAVGRTKTHSVYLQKREGLLYDVVVKDRAFKLC